MRSSRTAKLDMRAVAATRELRETLGSLKYTTGSAMIKKSAVRKGKREFLGKTERKFYSRFRGNSVISVCTLHPASVFSRETLKILVSFSDPPLKILYSFDKRWSLEERSKRLTVVSKIPSRSLTSRLRYARIWLIRAFLLFTFLRQGCKQQQSHVFCFDSDPEFKTPSSSRVRVETRSEFVTSSRW